MSLAVWWKARDGESKERYMADILRYTVARLGNREEGEDVAMEAYHALPAMIKAENPRLYALGVARRKVADALRHRRSNVPIGNADASPHQRTDIDTKLLVAATMAKLSDEHREALVLKYIHGLKAEEVGRVTGRSAKAVDSLLQRARAAFTEAAEGAFDKEN